MTNTVWIDRTAHQGGNGDRATRMETYYDYTIHVIGDGDGEHPNADNKVHEVRGYDNFNSHIVRGAEKDAIAYAEKLASSFGVEVKRAWEEGQVNYLVQVFVPVRAATREEAEQMVKQALSTNVIAARSRYHTTEGA